ncbi:MAG: hypothetical protein GY862_12100 [Gammaproteobacteria bacterium]|nr:hypothetical protein [Gammaproteobacteria bacterium]
MSWILTAIFIIIFFADFSFGGAVALTGMLFLLMALRSWEASCKLSERKNEKTSWQELADLVLLHLELTRLHQTGKLDSSRYKRLNREINALLYVYICGKLRINENSARRETAWSLLEKHAGQALGPRPWLLPKPTAAAAPLPAKPAVQAPKPTAPPAPAVAAKTSLPDESQKRSAPPKPVAAARPSAPLPAKPAVQAPKPTAPPAPAVAAKTSLPDESQRKSVPTKTSAARARAQSPTITVSAHKKPRPAPLAQPPAPPIHEKSSPAPAKKTQPAPLAQPPAARASEKTSEKPSPAPAKRPRSAPLAQPSAARISEKPSPGPTKKTQPAHLKNADEPEKPGALEQFMSGWVKRIYSHAPGRAFIYQIMIPFFLQNIGWFIAGICGISGSIYLVAATTGYWKALAVVFSLSIYTGILFGGGYLLRRKRPELVTSSGVLLALGVLLVPLNLAACVRLIAAAGTDMLFISIAAGVALVVLSGFAIAVRVASGIIDRGLTSEHPRLFMGLAALQFAVPFLGPAVHWLWAAALHLGLLGALGYALQRFTGHWLHSIFIDKRKIAYYAAGTLVYAALVSFVHLSRGAGMDFPEGYAGPFLMALSGLLFYVDTQFKQWARQYALLSRFTFVIYALSVLALLISANTSWVPLYGGDNYLISVAFSLSLAMGVLLYGGMVWKYLTLPPLYLLLICFSGLYAQLILQAFPNHWHFLLALPGLYAMMGLHRFARRRESAALALVTYRTMMGLILVLVAWSLFHSPFPPEGIIPMLTPLAAAGLMLQILGLTPARMLYSDGPSKRCYLLTGLAVLTLAYSPLLAGIWREQFGSGLIALAFLWTGWGLQSLRKQTLCYNEVLLNSALLSMAAGVVLIAGPQIAQHGLANTAAFSADLVMPPLLIAAGGVLLWLSLGLRMRALFYGAMILGGTGIMLLKFRYFPVSTGSGVLFLAISLWTLLWYLERRLALRTAMEEALDVSSEKMQPLKIPKENQPVILFWLFPVYLDNYPSRTHMLIPPLQQIFYLLWLISLWKVIPGIVSPQSGFFWAVLAMLSALTTLLAAGYSRPRVTIAGEKRPFPPYRAAVLICLLPLAALLLIQALLVFTPVSNLWQPCLVMGYAMLLWLFSFRLHTSPWTRLIGILGWRGGYGDRGGSKLSEQTLHWTVFALAFLSMGAVWFSVTAQGFMPFGEMNPPFAAFLTALALVLLFLWLSGQRYALRLHSYLFIGGAALGGFSLYSWISGIPPETLLRVRHAAPMLSLAAAGLALLAYVFDAFADSIYRRPLRHYAVLVYLCALTYGGLLFWVSWEQGRMITIWLPWIFVLLTLGLILLLHPPHEKDKAEGISDGAPAMRGIGIPALLSLAFAGIFPEQGLDPYLIIAWGLILWTAGHFILPRTNARWPQWAVQSWFCLILGLFSYAWALLDSLLLFWRSLENGTTVVWLPWLFMALALGYNGILRSLLDMPLLRSIGTALLWSIAFSSFFTGNSHLFPYMLVAWSFVLWGTGVYLLPWLNARFPQYFIVPAAWPVLGLVFVLSTLFASLFLEEMLLPDLPVWPILLGATMYLLLMLRSVTWGWLPWLAGLGVTVSGLSVLAAFLPETRDTFSPFSLPFLTGAAIWLNLVLQIMPALHAAGGTAPPSVARRRLDSAFFFWPSLLLCGVLALFTLLVLSLVGIVDISGIGTWPRELRQQSEVLITLAILLNFSAFHLFVLRARSSEKWGAFFAHLLLLSLTDSVLLLWLETATGVLQLPLLPGLWAALLQAVIFISPSKTEAQGKTLSKRGVLKRTAWNWLPFLYSAALLALLFAEVSSEERLLALVLLSGLSIGLGLMDKREDAPADSTGTWFCLMLGLFSYAWALLDSLLLFWRSLENGTTVVWLPWLFMALALGHSAILRSLPEIPLLRSSGAALLLSIAFSSFFTGDSHLLPYMLTVWSFVLWGTGIYLLPRFNARFPSQSLAPAVWPVLGLVFVLSTLFASAFLADALMLSPDLPVWPILLGATLYLLLMSRSVTWGWLPWLAGLGVTVSGLSVLADFLPETHDIFSPLFLTGAAIWLNLVLQIMPILHAASGSVPPSVARRRLDSALFFWPSLLLCGVLALFTLSVLFFLAAANGFAAAWPPQLKEHPEIFITLAILLIFSAFHLFILRARSSEKLGDFFAHLLLLSLTDAVLLLWLETATGMLQLPLLLGLWAALLQAIIFISPSKTEAQGETLSKRRMLKITAWKWLPFLYGAALLALVFAEVSSGGRLLALALLSGLSIGLGLMDRREDAPADLAGMRRWLARGVPFLSYLWALLESLWLLWAGWTQGIPVWLPPVFVLLALGQIPLLHRSSAAPAIRGITIPLLLTMSFISFIILLPFAAGKPENLIFVTLSLAFAGIFPEQGLEPYLIIAWGLILWTAGHFILPRTNARWPQWAVQSWFCLVLGFFSYAWALLDSLLLFWRILENGTTVVWLPWLFMALALGYSAILRSLPDMPLLRSIGAALLLSIAFSSFFTGDSHLLPYMLTAWSFVLWGTGVYLLPRFNARFPSQSLIPAVWPVLGLVFVLSTLFASLLLADVLLLLSGLLIWPILIGTTLYLLLMLRSVSWGWLAWLAGLGVTVSGLSVLAAFLPETHSVFFLTGAAIWLNLVLQFMPALHMASGSVPPSLARSRLDSALFFWPSLLLCGVLALFTLSVLFFLAAANGVVAWPPQLRERPEIFITLAILLIFSAFHLFVLRARSSEKWGAFFAHLLLLSLTDAVLLLWLETATGILQLPLLLGLWAALLQAIIFISPSKTEEQKDLPSKRKMLKITAWKWLPFLYGAALLALVFTEVSSGGRLLTLALLSGLSIGLGLLDSREDAPADLAGMRRWLARGVPFLSYLWALLESLWLLWTGWPQEISVWLPPVFVLLALGQIPLLHRSSAAPAIRGITVPLLLTMSFVSFIILLPFAAGKLENFIFALTGWGFVLWAAGNYGFPWLNARRPNWAVSAGFSLLLGLILVLGCFGVYIGMTKSVTWPLLAAVTLYLFLMQRNANWLAWPAAFCLTWLGAMLLLELFPLMPFKAAASGSVVSSILHLLPGYPSIPYVFGLLLWLNLLLHAPALWRGSAKESLALPLFTWPFLLLSGGLLGVSFLIVYTFLYTAGFVTAPVGADARVMALGAALALSFLHTFVLRPRSLTAQCLILSVQTALMLLFINRLGLPLLFSLCVIGLLFLPSNLRTQSSRLLDLHEKLSAARGWLPFNFGAALLCLVFMPNLAAGENILTLALLGGAGIALGLSGGQKRQWQAGGVALLIIALHMHWMLWLPQADWISLLPWYALQFALLGWLAIGVQKRQESSSSAKPEEISFLSKGETGIWLFTWLAPLLSVLAALEWLGHGVNFLDMIIARAEEEIRLFGVWDNAAAILAGTLLTGLWMQKIKNHNLLVYSLSAAILVLGAYIRLIWVGLTPFTVWDASALMAAGFALAIIQRFAPSSLPLYRITLILPVLALFTVPWQVGSVDTGSTLIAATAVFLLMQRSAGQSLPIYLALLALNTGIYLWVPGLVQEYRLVQIYTVPIAITVLLMLQLHLLELKPSVLNAVRLTALGALYAGAALDVFLRPEFYVFALALGLSLTGIVFGIALRVRPFLFTGVIFFVLNIAGQLVNFYPQDQLYKAIFLMVLGGVITGGMIWFSIQREAIMRQIRIIRADLAEWE